MCGETRSSCFKNGGLHADLHLRKKKILGSNSPFLYDTIIDTIDSQINTCFKQEGEKKISCHLLGAGPDDLMRPLPALVSMKLGTLKQSSLNSGGFLPWSHYSYHLLQLCTLLLEGKKPEGLLNNPGHVSRLSFDFWLNCKNTGKIIP